MSAQILSGKELSAEIREQLKERVSFLKKEKGITPGLAVIQVGNDGGSTVYVNNKEKACAEVGPQKIHESGAYHQHIQMGKPFRAFPLAVNRYLRVQKKAQKRWGL